MKNRIKAIILSVFIMLSVTSCSTANTGTDSEISVYIELADIYADEGNYSKAIQTIEKGLEVYDSDTLRLKLDMLIDEDNNSNSYYNDYNSDYSEYDNYGYGESEYDSYGYGSSGYDDFYSSGEPSGFFKGKYEYYSGDYRYSFEFKSNGTCIYEEEYSRGKKTRVGTYDYTDGEYLMSFPLDMTYISATYLGIPNGDYLTVSTVTGLPTRKGDFYRIE